MKKITSAETGHVLNIDGKFHHLSKKITYIFISYQKKFMRSLWRNL